MPKSVCRYLVLVLRKPTHKFIGKKPTLPVYHRLYWKRHKLLISPTFENSKIWMDPLISVVSLDRPGSRNPKPIWILAYRRFCIFSNFQISHLKISMWVRVLHKIITYYKKKSSLSHTEWPLLSYQFLRNFWSFNEKLFSKQV